MDAAGWLNTRINSTCHPIPIHSHLICSDFEISKFSFSFFVEVLVLCESFAKMIVLLLSFAVASAAAAIESCPYHPNVDAPLSMSVPEVSSAINALSKRIVSEMPTLNQTFGVTALHLSVTSFQRTIFSRGFGVKRYDIPSQETPPDHDTVFRIGSVTKLFTTLLCGAAIDQGIISSFDDPVKKLVSWFKVPNPPNTPAGVTYDLTWRQLVSQVSSICLSLFFH